MRVLHITTYHRTGGWLAEAFAADSACEVVLEEAVGAAAGLGRLRDEVFDAVLISHEPGELDALEFVEGLRGGGSEEPLVILGAQSEQELAAMAFEVGADAYVCVNTTTTRTVIWMVARAVERHFLARENRRLTNAEQHRLHLEHDEAERLLDQQRALIRDLETLGEDATLCVDSGRHDAPLRRKDSRGAEEAHCELPQQLVEHYRELLRAYVIMGSGNLAAEMNSLAELLANAGVSARQTMELHVAVLAELVHGLGARSARHVMLRADLLVLEVLVHLAEHYRHRYLRRSHPPVQRVLPGFVGGVNSALVP